MPPRYALPSIWLLTDPRMGDALWAALERLRPGSGIIVRHHHDLDRRAFYERVRRVARRRRLPLLLAGPPVQAAAWRADGAHGASRHVLPRRLRFRTMPAHDAVEVHRAGLLRADAILLSPVHPTRSHPSAPTLGTVRFGRLARHSKPRVIALGGMNGVRARALRSLGAYGWAAIDAFSDQAPDGPACQNRNAVPI